MTKAKPVHEVRVGKVRAAVWENSSENGSWHTVTLSRLYKDGEDWKDATSFGRDDLLALVKVADFVHTWILFQQDQGAEGATSAELHVAGGIPARRDGGPSGDSAPDPMA